MIKNLFRFSSVAIFLVAVATLSLFFRDGHISISDNFIFRLRINKVATIITSAFTIGFATYILQRTTRNKILDISFFGIASFNLLIVAAVYYMMFVSIDLSFLFNKVIPIMSIGISVFITGVVMFFSLRKGTIKKRTIVLTGIFLNYVFMAGAYMYLRRLPSNAASSIMDLTLGKVHENYSNMMLIGIICLSLLTVAWYIGIYKSIYVVNTNMTLAKKLGIKFKLIYIQIIIIVGLNAAVAFMLIGSVAFLGIIAANISMSFIGNRKWSAILSGFIAAIICLVANFIFNIWLELYYPVGMASTMISIPYFLYRIVKG